MHFSNDAQRLFFFFFCLFSFIASLSLFPSVFRVQEGPVWVCFSDAQPLLSGGRHGRAVDLYFTPAPNMVDLRGDNRCASLGFTQPPFTKHEFS
jgi:hypothetical protein